MPTKQEELGQYMTPAAIVSSCLEVIDLNKFNMLIEPSYGEGAFLTELVKQSSKGSKVLGVEFDKAIFKKVAGAKCTNASFYDIDFRFGKMDKVAFVGNPPYHTPAYSLKTNKQFVSNLMKKYNISNIKEEAVFFLVHTFDLLSKAEVPEYEIHYILPKAMFQNSSKGFSTFLTFLKENLNLASVKSIPAEFANVSQDLVLVSFQKGKQAKTVIIDDVESSIDSFYGQNTQGIDYRDIFVKTHLGSVPAESIFLSIRGETKEAFKERLLALLTVEPTIPKLQEVLHFKGTYHLKVLNGSNEEAKARRWETIASYVAEMQERNLATAKDINTNTNFKRIQHRTELRWYFRLENLKKASFVYLLNPNPTKSFFFTARPTSLSTDYFGYCDYDVNRNSTPGGIRTVPISTLSDNLTDSFKKYWDKNTKGLDYAYVPSYLEFISKSVWYKSLKAKYHRIYFSVPKTFDKTFLETLK